MRLQCKKYDVVLVDFGTNIGSEQSGKRPCVIIQNDKGNFFGNTTLVIPMTSQIKNLNQATHALIKCGDGKGIIKNSMLLGECTRQISEQRITKVLGHLKEEEDKIKIKQVYLANFGED